MGLTPEKTNEQRTTAYKTAKNAILPLQPPVQSGSTAPETPKAPAVPAESAGDALRRSFAAASQATKRISGQLSGEPVTLGRLSPVDSSAQEGLLRQLRDAASQQAEKKSDYTVEQGVAALKSAEEDAAADFRSRRDRISAEERNALDNQALYAELRGDRGGIGRAQYASVQNTAAANRLAVDREQQKLSADTARSIAQLRAQGEFDKADKLLALTQSYLSELMTLKRWAAETNMDTEQFNTELARWEADYALNARRYAAEAELNAAKVTGALADGTPTESAVNAYRTQLAAAGQAMLNNGLEPTPAQLEAMGWSEEQYRQYREGRSSAAAAAETARLTGPIYIRENGQLKQVTKREYREYLAEKAK